jgi:ABC-type glycerol-3-phosphate transport system substrate-binding protein
MKNLSTFQIALLSICALAIFIGVLIFSGTIPGFRSEPGGTLGTVTLWGPVSEEEMRPFIDAFNKSYSDQFTVIYFGKSAATIEAELVDALASGTGPDLAILPADAIYHQANKILTIPYETLALRDFKDTFVEAGEVFLTPTGSLALPILVDPLVMYYNRDILSGEGIATPPATWSAFRQVVKDINVIDNSAVIKRTALAMGEFSNNRNAKAVLSLLLLQAGTPIVAYNETGYRSVLDDSFGGTISPGQAALDFFTQFANSGKDGYSWNRSLPEARDAFAAGILATYFGFGSELSAVKAKNPNLNFDVTTVPQRDTGRKLTFAHVYGLAILKNTANINGAVQAASTLASSAGAKPLAEVMGLPSARRDLLTMEIADPFKAAFNRSAIMSVSWLDPNSLATEQIFSSAVQRVTSGQSSPFDSITRASLELNAFFNK